MKFLFEENNSISVIPKFENDDTKYFKGNFGEILPNENSNSILLGLGKKENKNSQIIVSAFRNLGRFCNEHNIESIKIDFKENELLNGFVLEIAEGLISSNYNFDRYKSVKTQNALENIYFTNLDNGEEVYKEKIEELKIIVDSFDFTKELVNMRSNEIYPSSLAKKISKKLSDYGISVEVYDKDEIKKLGMNAFLSVARGSSREPKLIVMKYSGAKDKNPIAFVGKGLTYDSGGYSLKPSDGMKTMHTDMAGAATVAGAILAIAKNKLKTNVIGIIAACENSVSGKSYKPGDVIQSLSGKTIEIDNTDAEGRVTLSDSVYYAADRFNPECIIDLATLTGACIVALGHEYTAMISNDENLTSKFKSAAKISSEKVWELPNDPEFKKLNSSDVADIKNNGGRAAGTITAGQFIGEFNKDCPWIHLDIAGTSYLEEKSDFHPQGATGVMVKTLYNFSKLKAQGDSDED